MLMFSDMKIDTHTTLTTLGKISPQIIKMGQNMIR